METDKKETIIDEKEAQRAVYLLLKTVFLKEAERILYSHWDSEYEEFSDLKDILKSSYLETYSVYNFISEMERKARACSSELKHLLPEHYEDTKKGAIDLAYYLVDLYKKEDKDKKLHRNDIASTDAIEFEALRESMDALDKEGKETPLSQLSEFGRIIRKYFINSPYGDYTYSEMIETMRNVKECYRVIRGE
jgi:hypothetical protein